MITDPPVVVYWNFERMENKKILLNTDPTSAVRRLLNFTLYRPFLAKRWHDNKLNGYWVLGREGELLLALRKHIHNPTKDPGLQVELTPVMYGNFLRPISIFEAAEILTKRRLP